jgi:hypothetical protein
VARDGVIRRILQIVLDKAAAVKAERDAKKSLAGIDSGLTSLGNTAKRIGGILAAAFGIRALVAFGKSAVREALESEKAWSELAGTVRAAGGDFEAMEGNLRALGKAFQDVTKNTDEDYANALSRVITLTGDVAAATNNMGMIANVAAQFFGGELGPAVELVSKIMNGNVMMLGRMGIKVKSAQAGLEILASRSFGAAERQAKTFGGRLAKLNVGWDDFKEELGDVLVGSDDANSALSVLSGTVKTMVQWVKDNKDAMREWVVVGINAAIGAMQTLLGLVRDFAQLRGTLPMTLGAAPVKLSTNKAGLEAQIKGFASQRKQAEQEQAAALAALEKFQKGFLGTGLVLGGQANPRLLQLNTDLAVANDLLEKIDANAAAANEALKTVGAPKEDKPSLFGKPMTGKNLNSPLTEAQIAYDSAMASIRLNTLLSGDEFDSLGEEVRATETIMKAFGENGVGPSDKRMMAFATTLKDLKAAQAFKELSDELLRIGESARLLLPPFDASGERVAALTTFMNKLTAAGKDASAVAKDIQTETLAGVVNQFSLATADAASMQAAIGPQATTVSEMFANRLSLMTSEADRLRSAMEAIPESMRASAPEFAAYAQRYNDIQGAILKTNAAQQLAGEIATDVAGAMTAALEGSLGAYAASKAKQNLLQAAELGLQAAASVIFSLGIATGPLLALAAKHLVVAAAWGALAGASGGFSGGGGAAGGGGAGLTDARGVSGAASQESEPPSQEVNIFLTGPGFNAINPEVQKVTWGAMQNARERFGRNANIRIVRRP